MQPLVLAIEPDLRQAAIVKRIVREKVLADVTVVDSRDAALEAMRTKVPDVLLLSALLSPRDEDELFAHLRTLQHAEHLQTHTIPQLASAIGQDEDKPRGLLSAFRRRKDSGSAPAGCDPDLFADEIRTYLQRAADKKRELRDNPARETAVSVQAPAGGVASAAHEQVSETDAPAPESSWASPFEWRPTRTESKSRARKAVAPEPPRPAAPEPAVVTPPERVVLTQPEAAVVAKAKPARLVPPEPVVARQKPLVLARPEPVGSQAAEAAVVPDPEAVVVAAPKSALIPQPRSVLLPRSEVAAKEQAPVVRKKLPLSKRHAREWWFEGDDPKTAKGEKETDSEMREVLASLSVPLHVAAIGYADGCRIRRVRVAAD